jgi:hypothetical protein
MGAANWEDCEFAFQRHLPNKAKMRRMRDLPGFNRAAINAILANEPQEPLPFYLSQLRALEKDNSGNLSKRYHVWEYYGSVNREEMQSLLMGAKPSGWESWLADVLESDETDFRVVVWFCQGKLLRLADWPNDTGELPFDVWSFMERTDRGPIGGIGVPRILRDPQAAANGGWRMMLDNAALASGPQIVVDKSSIAPADGNWTFGPRKIWHRIKTVVAGASPPFEQFEIRSNQTELMNIITLAREFAEEECSLPQIAQGEQGEFVTPTATGMSLLMSSANVIFRWAVRNWDDQITSRHIGRYYDWNMQHNPDESIKGDMKVVARGWSALLAKDAQAQTLLAVAERWTVHPVLGPLVDVDKAARSALHALSVSPDAILKTDAQLQADQMAAASAPPQPTPQEITAQARLEGAKIDAESRVTVAEIGRDVAMQNMAGRLNMDVSKVQAQLSAIKQKIESDERKMAAQVAVDQRKDMAAAESVPGAAGGGMGIA